MNSKAIIAIFAVVIVVVGGSATFIMMNNGGSDDVTLILGTTENTGPISTSSSSFYEQRRMIVQEPIIGFGHTSTYEILTAESYTSKDNVTWDVKLKSGIVWSDGEKYTSDDIKHTVDIYSIARPNVVSNIDSVIVVDETNFKIVLKKAASELGGVVSNMPILPWHIWKDYKITTAEDYQKITYIGAFIGTGPYKVSSLNSTGDELTYVFNGKFRESAPKVTKIIFKHYGQEGAMVAALLAGEIDATYNYGTPGISASYLDKIKGAGNVEYMNVITGGIPADILFNMRNSVAADDNFRNAFKYAVDYEEIIKYVAPATGSVANSGLAPPTIDGYVDTAKLAKDMTMAERYMKAYFTDHSLTWGSDKVSVDVLVWSTSDADRFTNIFNLLKEQLAKINVTLNPISAMGAEFSPTARSEKTAMTIWFMTDAAIKNYAGFATHYISATGTLKFVFGDSAVNDAYEQIVTDMNAATTDAAKKSCAERFQKFYEENAVAIPLYWGGYIQPYSTSFTGWKCSPSSGLLSYDNLFGLQKA